MKKYLAGLICAVFIFALVPVPKENHSAAEIRIEIDDAEFDESSIMALIKPNMGGISLFSSEPTLEDLGIAEAENLDEPMPSEVSLFSAESEAAVYKLTLAEPGRENVLETIEKLNGLSYIELAEPNYICKLFSTPNDKYYTQGDQYGLNKIDAPKVWDMDINCSDVVVAVLDTGALISHPDLAANIWTNPGEIPDNGIDDDGNGYIDDVNGWDFANNDNNPTDDKGHGTHVSGIISAVTNNSIGVASLSRNAKILPLKIFNANGETTNDKRYKAIRYIEKMNIPIANCSYGSSVKTQFLEDAVKDCKNTLFITAAGNAEKGDDGVTKPPTNNDINPIYPASYDSDNVISIAATDKDDNKSTFSNYGTVNVDIAAPGTAITGTYINKNGGATYASVSGTSQASPMAASAAAVIKAKYPDITPQGIITALEEGADKLDTLTEYVKTGARLNAYGALEKAELIMATPTPISVEISIKYEDESAVVTAPSGTYCIIFALYKDNSLMKMEPVKAEFAETGEHYVPMNISEDGADSVKAMLWEMNSMRPLCKSDERRFFE